MRINFNPSIQLFKNKNQAQIIQLLPKYQKYFKPIFNQLITESNFSPTHINSIHIIPSKTSYGITIPSIKEGKLILDIELSDEIIPYICVLPDSNNTFKAKSIFQHEIFHCIEIKHLFDTNILQSLNLLSDDFVINTTYNFLLDEAVKLWSEFYAVYNNRKINEWHEVPDARTDIESLHKEFTKLISSSKINSGHQVMLSKNLLYCLHTFWYHITSLIALHIRTNEDVLIQDYANSESQIIQEYFKYIYSTLKTYFNNYPTWLSKDSYLELGTSFMSIIHFYNLDFSTDDLSDNFILKYIKEP